MTKEQLIKVLIYGISGGAMLYATIHLLTLIHAFIWGY